MQSLLICMIFISTMGHSVMTQKVNSRAANPDEPRISAGPDSNSGLVTGQARNIYSQKLSGHRMMHFGKKQFQVGAPDLITQNNQASEVYPMMAAGSEQAVRRRQLLPYPYARFSQIISEDELKAILRRQQLMDMVKTVFEDVSEECNACFSKQTKQKRPSEPKQQVSPMRRMLVDNGEVDLDFDFLRPKAGDGSDFFDIDRHRANAALFDAKEANDEQVGEQQGQDNGNINVVSRSVPMKFGPDMPSETRALISNLLFGRQTSQRQTPPPNYVKKYEPNRMKFMHFG